MKTTLLNPTLWVLSGTMVMAAVGIVRKRSARDSGQRTVRYACRWPVLGILVLMSAVGLVSRVAMGAVAMRDTAGGQAAAVGRLLSQTAADEEETRLAFKDWMWPAGQARVPWDPVPASPSCPVKEMATRVPLFTTQADSPMMLVAAAPVMSVGGTRALGIVFLVLAVGAVAVIGLILLNTAGISWRSREGLLLFAILAGWQPILAGLRQADIVLPAAACVLSAWYLLRTQRPGASGFAAAIATGLALPAIGVLPALVRSVPRAAVIGTLSLVALATVTLAVAGLHTAPGFIMTMAYAAQMWSPAPTNYSAISRAMAAQLPAAIVVSIVLAALVLSWWRSRTIDAAFGAFLTLGLLLAPVLWSQDFTLLLVPAAVLMRRVWLHGSSVPLLAGSVLVILCSLPDPAVVRLNTLLPLQIPGGDLIPIGSFALIVLWLWMAFGAQSPQPRPASAVISAA